MRKALFLTSLLVLAACKREPIERLGPTPTPVVQEVSCPASTGAQWHVTFSPNGGATEAVVAGIGKAQKTIYVQAYSFTSTPIAEALISAHKRKVKVVILLDKSNENGKGSSLSMLVNSGIPVYLDCKHAIAHNKIIIIDSKTVFTGSFNFTAAAEKSNAENSLELTDPKLAEVYTGNWNAHKEHSTLQKQ